MRDAPDRSADASVSAGPTAAVVLAAGRGTRLGGSVPKVLVQLLGTPLLVHVLGTCRAAGVARLLVVAGEHEEAIRRVVGDGAEVVRQASPRGTGDALRAARPALEGFRGDLLVLVGDAPLLSPVRLAELLDQRRSRGDAATLLTARFPRTPPYGRVVRSADGAVLRLVEEAVATPAERALREVSTFPFCFDAARVLPRLDELRPNSRTGEIQLPDLVDLLVRHGETVSAVEAADPWETLGVNDADDLARAGEILRRRGAATARNGGAADR